MEKPKAHDDIVWEAKVKLCKDCIHYRKQPNWVPFCARTTKVDLVEGGETHTTCNTERAYAVIGGCGPEGMWFEALPEWDHNDEDFSRSSYRDEEKALDDRERARDYRDALK